MTNPAQLPTAWRALRDKVERFVEDRVYPLEPQLDDAADETYFALMRPLMDEAKSLGIWALGHPRDIGGQSMPFAAYALINEVIGRAEHAIVALGTHTLQNGKMP